MPAPQPTSTTRSPSANVPMVNGLPVPAKDSMEPRGARRATPLDSPGSLPAGGPCESGTHAGAHRRPPHIPLDRLAKDFAVHIGYGRYAGCRHWFHRDSCRAGGPRGGASVTSRLIHHQPAWMTHRSQRKLEGLWACGPPGEPDPSNQTASRGIEPDKVGRRGWLPASILACGGGTSMMRMGTSALGWIGALMVLAAGAEAQEDFEWSGRMERGQTLEVIGISGDHSSGAGRG